MTDITGHTLTVALGDQEVQLTVNCPHAAWSSAGVAPEDYPPCRKDPAEPWLDHGQCLLAELVTELGPESLLPDTSVPLGVGTVLIRGWWNSPKELAIAPVIVAPSPPRFCYTHETCPNCLNRDARETKGMVCQSCGHDYAPDSTAQGTITTYTPADGGPPLQVEGSDPRVLRSPGCCCVVAATESGVPLTPEQARHLAGRLLAAAGIPGHVVRTAADLRDVGDAVQASGRTAILSDVNGDAWHVRPSSDGTAVISMLVGVTPSEVDSVNFGWLQPLGPFTVLSGPAAGGIPVPQHRTIAGCCPMGCGETLVLDDTGRVTCSSKVCPQPDAATCLLADADTEHVVTFAAVGFTIRHPTRERLHGDLEQCDLHRYCSAMADPPPPGRYRVERDHVERGWSFTLAEVRAVEIESRGDPS